MKTLKRQMNCMGLQDCVDGMQPFRIRQLLQRAHFEQGPAPRGSSQSFAGAIVCGFRALVDNIARSDRFIGMILAGWQNDTV
jgi:hypothetical protein